MRLTLLENVPPASRRWAPYAALITVLISLVMIPYADSSGSARVAAPGQHGAPAGEPDGLSQPSGRAFYVAPTGLPTNDGSQLYPLDLPTALSSQGPVRPGDTVWL